MDAMVTFYLNFCIDCGTDEGSYEKVRRGIPFVRREEGAEGPRMPRILLLEFCNRLMKKFSVFGARYESRAIRNGTQIIMDDTIIGLECPSKVLASLRQEDVDRIRGIGRLLLTNELTHNLESLHLENLTTFVYRRWCTDSDLRVIGETCPRLKHVDVRASAGVSDVGLGALALCPDLQFVSITWCMRVSGRGAKDLLSVNKTVRELFAWTNDCGAGFDFREISNWDKDLSVYPSIESFTVGQGFSDRHLRYVVAKFPNLRSIKIRENFDGDFRVLRTLSKLSKIEFPSRIDSTWAAFESLFEFFGPQIRYLQVCWGDVSVAQIRLNSIFRICENLEYLIVYCRSATHAVKLIVPPFKKLKYFKCGGGDKDREVTLEFGQMSMLENLQVIAWFALGASQIESIILDHTNFPNLKRIGLTTSQTLSNSHLNEIAKNNNLDFVLADDVPKV